MSSDDKRTLLFTCDALDAAAAGEDSTLFNKERHAPADAVEAIRWAHRQSNDDRIFLREQQIRAIEARAHEMIENGTVEHWWRGACPLARRVAATVNGPLCQELLKQCGHKDESVVGLFKHGARILGRAPMAFNGVPADFDEPTPVCELRARCAKQNSEVLKRMREDSKHSAELWRQTLAEVELGRMTAPKKATAVDLAAILLSPRFGAAQTKEDGSTRVRSIDDFSISLVNGAFKPCEKLRYDTVDILFELAKARAQRVMLGL